MEEEFWEGLKTIARERGIAVAAPAQEIHKDRGAHNLSSTIRLFCSSSTRKKPTRNNRWQSPNGKKKPRGDGPGLLLVRSFAKGSDTGAAVSGGRTMQAG